MREERMETYDPKKYENNKKEQRDRVQEDWYQQEPFTVKQEEPKSCYDTQKKRSGLGLGIYIIAILSLVFFYVVMFGRTAANEYLERGIETNAVVTEIESGNVNPERKTYYCTYVDADGVSRRAELIPNSSTVYVGEKFQGYYLPEDLETVWCEPSKGMNMVLKGFACLFGLLAALVLIQPVILWIWDRIKEYKK